jgi:hypothetical protein
MATPNDDLAGKVGLDKGTNDPRDAYDAQHGRYVDSNPADLSVPEPPVTNPPPFGAMNGKR